MNARNFAPIPCPIPDPRPPVRYIPRHVMSRPEAIRACVDNQDSSDVLEALVDSGELDAERVNEMLEANHERRLANQAKEQA